MRCETAVPENTISSRIPWDRMPELLTMTNSWISATAGCAKYISFSKVYTAGISLKNAMMALKPVAIIIFNFFISRIIRPKQQRGNGTHKF